MKVSRGKIVSLRYTLKGDDGDVLDSSEGHGPLRYLHGYDGLLPALERALEGMSAGESATVDLPAADAYGDHDPDAVIRASREQFPEDVELVPGLEVAAQGPDGMVTFRVLEVHEGGAVLDANHPLAGQNLHFDVQVVDVREATADELAHGHAHGPDGHHHA
jgi:FKBP-type peptidyl-prolyl cis-trans isomerase SlyD